MKKSMFKILPLSVVGLMVISLTVGVLINLPANVAQAAAVNTATKIDVTPGTQYTTAKGIPVYRLVVTGSGNAEDSITTLSPTPAGTVDDTKVTLHFYLDRNQNGIVDHGFGFQEDDDLGASAAFDVNNTKKTFDIINVTIVPGASQQILITADFLAETNANNFTLGFAAAGDIVMTSALTVNGSFPLDNANALTISNTAPAVTVANGAADPIAKTVEPDDTDQAVKQLLITTAAGTADSLVSLDLTPSEDGLDNTSITAVTFYIDSGASAGEVDNTDALLITAPTVYAGDDTKTSFVFSSPVPLPIGTLNILVAYDIGARGAIIDGEIFKTELAASTDFVAGSGVTVTQDSTASAAITVDFKPIVISAVTGDSAPANGHLDKITVVYSEAVNDANYDALAVTGYTVPGTGSGSGTATLVYNLTPLATYDTGETPVITFTNANATDLTGNLLDNTAAPATATDGAAPVLISTTPANGATAVSVDADLVAIFSEAMNAGTVAFTMSPDPGGWVPGTLDSITLTLAHNDLELRPYTVTITAANDNQGNPLVQPVTSPVPNPWSFSTLGHTAPSTPAPTCVISINNGAASTTSLNVDLAITTNTAVPNMIISNNDLFIGSAWEAYAATKSWALSGDYGAKTVYAMTRDSIGRTSPVCAVSIYYIAPGTTPPTEPPITPPTPDENLVLTDPTPASALPTGVSIGQLVKRADISAVYFIDQDNRRHAFPNTSIYYSWYTDFSGVQTISASTLAAIPLGTNVTMRPGTYLVKIQSDPKVYAVEPYGVLRWVSTEQIATDLYGTNWNQRIIDVEPTFFANYQVGSNITTSTHPTGSVIQYTGETQKYYILSGAKELVSSAVFTGNLFQDKFVCKNVSATITYTAGADMAVTPIQTLMTLR